MVRIVPILLFLAAFLPRVAAAQTNPAYVVNDVKVDIVAESSVKARNQAFSAAQAQAFQMLATRFIAPDQMAGFTPPDPGTIAGMVSDFEITSEQSSTRRYLGTYIFRFKAAAVTRYFGHGPLANYEQGVVPDQQLLVLPYFSQNGKSVLWDVKKNPWLEVWQKQRADSDRLLIPNGDISDTMDVRDTAAENLTQSGLKRIRARYNANDVVIVSAVFDQAAADILTVRIYRTDRGRVELVQSLPVPKGDATKLGELLANAVAQTKPILTGNWKGQAETVVPELTAQDGTAAPAPAQSASAYQLQSGQIKATTRFVTIGDWLSVRRALNGIAPLKEIRITSLTTNQASMELGYSDWMALTSSLSARGLSLQAIGPGEYNLIKIPNRIGTPR